jgi:hypothetical protein
MHPSGPFYFSRGISAKCFIVKCQAPHIHAPRAPGSHLTDESSRLKNSAEIAEIWDLESITHGNPGKSLEYQRRYVTDLLTQTRPFANLTRSSD